MHCYNACSMWNSSPAPPRPSPGLESAIGTTPRRPAPGPDVPSPNRQAFPDTPTATFRAVDSVFTSVHRRAAAAIVRHPIHGYTLEPLAGLGAIPMPTQTRAIPPAAAAATDHLADLSARLDAARVELDGLYHELERLNRLAAMGTIAGMIAHEFNNILAPMLTYSQMALSAPHDIDLTRKALQRSVSGTERAAKVADAILRFVRDDDTSATHPTKLAPREGTSPTCVVRAVVEDAITCLARDPARDGVRVETSIPAEMHAAIDAAALQQVLVNLILNARHAIGNRAGTLRISAGTHASAPATPAGAADSRNATSSLGVGSMWNTVDESGEDDATRRSGWVVLSIQDNGPGIAPERLARMFRPFNTDGGSAVRRGTGLGLVICQRLVAAAGGWIVVESGATPGTTISIVLPIA